MRLFGKALRLPAVRGFLHRRRMRADEHAADLRSLFVVSLPRSLSSLLYGAAAASLGLARPAWTTDGEILNRDRVPRRLQDIAPAGERFTLLGSAPEAFADMTTYLDGVALRQGFAYKDVVQPFVVGGWEGLGDFKVLKVRRDLSEVAYAMLKRQWWYPTRAASLFDARPWSLVEGLVRAEAVFDALPGETVDYADAVIDHEPLEAALRRLYPDAQLDSVRYIDRRFIRTRGRLESERRDSIVYRRLEWVVSAVRERLRLDEPSEEIVEALP
jgi:hypothetical protein